MASCSVFSCVQFCWSSRISSNFGWVAAPRLPFLSRNGRTSPNCSNSWWRTSHWLHHLVWLNIAVLQCVCSFHSTLALWLWETRDIQRVENMFKVGVWKLSPTMSRIWEKHPNLRSFGCTTLTLCIAALFMLVLSLIPARSKWEWIPVIVDTVAVIEKFPFCFRWTQTLLYLNAQRTVNGR